MKSTKSHRGCKPIQKSHLIKKGREIKRSTIAARSHLSAQPLDLITNLFRQGASYLPTLKFCERSTTVRGCRGGGLGVPRPTRTTKTLIGARHKAISEREIDARSLNHLVDLKKGIPAWLVASGDDIAKEPTSYHILSLTYHRFACSCSWFIGHC